LAHSLITPSFSWRAYIINLDRAKDRWSFVQQAFASTQFELCRISAVDGKALPSLHPDYPEELYHRFHGRPHQPWCHRLLPEPSEGAGSLPGHPGRARPGR